MKRQNRSNGIKTLISVISPEEVKNLPGLPAFLDVKDPALGPLGMAAPALIREVRRIAGPEAVISAALGDAENDPRKYAARAVAAAEAGADIVKAGLVDFRLGEASAFTDALRSGLDRAGLPARVVAAAYADRVNAAFLDAFPAAARAGGAWGCLIDTWEKDGKGLGHYLNKDVLRAFCANCRARGLVSVLAGGLTERDIPWLIEAGPDVAGFRSAVCKNGRGLSGIDAGKVRAVLTLLRDAK